MDQTPFHGKQSMQFTSDDAARITASAIKRVLEELNVEHIVEGIAVLPAGEGMVMVDMVMRDLSSKDTWAVSITIPAAKEQTDGLT